MTELKKIIALIKFIVFIAFLVSCQNNQKNSETIRENEMPKISANKSPFIIVSDSLKKLSQYQNAFDYLDTVKQQFNPKKNLETYLLISNEQTKILGNISDSLKLIFAQKTAKITNPKLDKNNVQSGFAYQMLADTYLTYEEYDSSILYFDKSINIFEKNQFWEDYAWAIVTKSVNYYYKSEYQLFKKELLFAQNIYKKYDLKDIEIIITIYDLLGVAYDKLGDFDKTINNIELSINLYLEQEKISHRDSGFIAHSYMNIGRGYFDMGAFQQSTDYLLKGIDFTKGNDLKIYSLILLDISTNHFQIKNYTKSIKYAYQGINAAKDLSKKDSDKIKSIAYTNLGSIFFETQQFDSATYYLKKAILIGKNETLFRAKNDYISLLIEQNKTDEALNILNSIDRNKVRKYNLFTQYFRNYGMAYSQNGDFEKAALYFQLALNHHFPDFVDTTNILANPRLKRTRLPLPILADLKFKAIGLSQFSDNIQSLDAALATYELATQWIDTLLQSYAFDENKILGNQRNRAIYEQGIEVAYQLYQKTKDKKYIQRAFNLSEKIKSNVLLPNLQTDDNQLVIPKELKQQEQTLVSQIAFYERQLQLAKDSKEEDKIELYQSYLTDYNIDLNELRYSLKKNYPEYYDLKHQAVLSTISDLQKDLNNNQGFVSYYSGDSSTYVFTISKDDFYFSKVGQTTTINNEIIAFRQIVDQPNSTIEGFTQYDQTATDLYSMVLQQSVEQLPKSVNQLIIIPDGTLNYIPFEILTNKVIKTPSQDFSKLSYLLYDYQIHYAYSATLLRENERLQNQLKTNDKCLAYAPSYISDNQPIAKRRGTMQTLRDGTMQLQGTGKEIQAIATHFNGDFDQSETATKANFVKQAPNFGILHLAMHGEANFENENLANLKFANTKTQEKEQYLLYQNEIANMNLNTQLVVLSACETGLGKYIYGEGIASLGRSFMYAGVPSIVMSLWKVDDKATSRLMPYFYENLAQGMNKDEALYQAKLTFLKKEDFSTLHPHYWAGFVSIGDVQPIKKGRNWGVWLIIGASFLLLGSGFLLWRKFNNKG